jgi:hypothetical protein
MDGSTEEDVCPEVPAPRHESREGETRITRIRGPLIRLAVPGLDDWGPLVLIDPAKRLSADELEGLSHNAVRRFFGLPELPLEDTQAQDVQPTAAEVAP